MATTDGLIGGLKQYEGELLLAAVPVLLLLITAEYLYEIGAVGFGPHPYLTSAVLFVYLIWMISYGVKGGLPRMSGGLR